MGWTDLATEAGINGGKGIHFSESIKFSNLHNVTEPFKS